MGYFKQTFKGVTWMGALRIATRVISIIKVLILARLLTPVQFGLFGITSVVLALLEILTETGVNALLIQNEKDVKIFIDTAWVVSIFRGVVVTLFLILLAKPASLFFKSPEVLGLVLFTSLIPFVRGFINPSEVKFQKKLEFGKEFTFRFTIISIDTLVSVTTAFILHNASSLIWGMLAGAISEVILSHIFITPRPIFKFKLKQMTGLLNRGKWITFSGIFNYLFENLDDIAVSKIMNTYNLGLYQMAYKISSLPITEGGEILQKVTFPVYVKISGEQERLKNAFIRVGLVTAVVVLPYGLLIYFFPGLIVTVLLGKPWLEIVPVLRILAILGVTKAIFGTASTVFLATKKQNYITVITFVSFLGLAVSIIPLIHLWGIIGAAISALFGWLLAVPFIIYFLRVTFHHEKSEP